jgi:hypothetical protein
VVVRSECGKRTVFYSMWFSGKRETERDGESEREREVQAEFPEDDCVCVRSDLLLNRLSESSTNTPLLLTFASNTNEIKH